MWSIRVLSGQQSGQIYDLKAGKNVFGRGGVSDLKIQSLGISKEHCEIHVYKDKMMIVDLKSSNGTFVNGVKIQNSIIRVGDKVSLFDVIMDVIPAPDIRPKATPAARPAMQNPPVPVRRRAQPVPAEFQAPPVPMGYPQQGSSALQMSAYSQAQPLYQAGVNPFGQAAAPIQPAAPQLSFSQKFEHYVENVVMPSIYKLGIVFSFKQILQAFVIIFIFSVTLLSAIPLSNIIKESNKNEAKKRVASIAHALAKINEAPLLAGQMSSVSVQGALQESGVTDAFIVQQLDGQIVAPPERVGRDESNPLVLKARTESRASEFEFDSKTIGASFPILVFKPEDGEAVAVVKYHAIVTYDIGSLNMDDGRVISLFMQTLAIASIFGLLLYQLFARLIEFPIRSLNSQIEKALIEKTDKTEVAFDYPSFQHLVSNVNTILNRVLTGDPAGQAAKPQQNKDLEYSNLAEMISHPVLVVDAEQRVVAINDNFEQLAQTTRDVILNQNYQTLTDSALVQNIESLVARSKQSPFEKQSDKIPFSQFECEVYCQAFLNANGEAEYFVLTLVQINA